MDGPYVWRFQIWELLSKCSILEPSLVQVMTARQAPYCPKSVELELIESNNGQITNRTLCAKMEDGYYMKFLNDDRNNEKVHETTEGNC